MVLLITVRFIRFLFCFDLLLLLLSPTIFCVGVCGSVSAVGIEKESGVGVRLGWGLKEFRCCTFIDRFQVTSWH